MDEWKKLDSKVNKYPSTRVFNAIGATDDPASFTKDMVAAVESVVGPVHSECVSSRPSSGGKYTAVRVQAMVQNGDQVRGAADGVGRGGGACASQGLSRAESTPRQSSRAACVFCWRHSHRQARGWARRAATALTLPSLPVGHCHRATAIAPCAPQVVDIFAKIKEVGGSRLKWYM